jgi:hypothetical protein
MRKQLDRLDESSRLLDKVMSLPPGHPDRLRYLALAEQSLEDRPSAPANRRRGAPPASPHRGPQARTTRRSSA